MIVAIDGPAGAGKSTVARAVADALGFRYLDTGALYRAVTVAAHRREIDPADVAPLARLAAETDMNEDGSRLTVAGQDVTDALRDPAASAAVSVVAAHPQVRAALIPIQKQWARSGDVVVEGRDIGTTVFPGAQVKLFLTADANERAKRRAAQLGSNDPAEIDRIAQSISERDRVDSSRSTSPLTRADDAVLIDTSDMPFDEVVGRIVEIVREASP